MNEEHKSTMPNFNQGNEIPKQRPKKIELIEQGRVIGNFIGRTKQLASKTQPVPHDSFAQMKLHGVLYQGPFFEGIRQGLGRIVYINGDTFYGFFKNNEAQGFGIMIHSNNAVYFGQFKNSKKHGICFHYQNLNEADSKKKQRKKAKYYADKIDTLN